MLTRESLFSLLWWWTDGITGVPGAEELLPIVLTLPMGGLFRTELAGGVEGDEDTVLDSIYKEHINILYNWWVHIVHLYVQYMYECSCMSVHVHTQNYAVIYDVHYMYVNTMH